MADAAVEFLFENIKELVANKKGEIDNLETDLRFLRVFLRDTVKKRRKDEYTTQMVREIRDVVYEAEDIIDAFVTKAAVEKSPKNSSSRPWKNAPDLLAIGTKVENIRDEVDRSRAYSRIVTVDDEDNHRKPERRPQRYKNVVGFKDVTEDLIRRLSQETDYFDVISVIGMFGLGKTTVAWKVFNDPQICYNFPTRIWLSVSEEFTDREMFLDILNELTTINDDMLARKDHELADLVAALLERGSFLIVMDDVWETGDWDRLHAALPEDNTKGKVLITSRIEGVGYYASRPRPPYNLRLFKFEESWELLRLEALGKMDCPSELELVGRKIVKSCDGLPLAIVVIGGILQTRSSDSHTIATIGCWEDVSKQAASSYFREMDPADRMQKSISLSYDKLAYHLRPCFLYFGLFPKDYEIPVSKLIRMWIGEGFVQQELDYSLEETAEKYLDDLINRNLVISDKFKLDGTVKTCRVHDTVLDFCRVEAANEILLQEIKYERDGRFTPCDIVKCRHLSIHSKCLKFISSKPSVHRARSFVCFSKDKYVVSPENSTNIIGAFKLLRVLDVSPFTFTKIDGNIYNMHHLRYIALSSVLSVLPSKFNQLWNIQTLIVDTTCRTLKVEADIWKMNQLRHFKTNASATLPKSTKSDKKTSAELQTLSFISVESCTEELSDRAPNLKKLGIRGQLALLFDRRHESFDSLGKMRELGKLKLINDAYPNPRREGGLGSLPEYDKFPPGLTSLTLCATFLSWEHMSTLGLLERLKVLKLKDNAFRGSILKAVDGGFQRLELLHFEETDLIIWNASSHHYPKLRSLVLKYCEKLRGIPAELADIPSLQKLELHTCISAAKSAKDIYNAKKQTLAEGSEFVLSIYPPIQ